MLLRDSYPSPLEPADETDVCGPVTSHGKSRGNGPACWPSGIGRSPSAGKRGCIDGRRRHHSDNAANQCAAESTEPFLRSAGCALDLEANKTSNNRHSGVEKEAEPAAPWVTVDSVNDRAHGEPGDEGFESKVDLARYERGHADRRDVREDNLASIRDLRWRGSFRRRRCECDVRAERGQQPMGRQQAWS